MTNKEIYRIWAPTDSIYSPWVRPVPFIYLNKFQSNSELISVSLPNIYYLTEYQENTALFIDLPGIDSIKEGISLAYLGYRPIPLFNGTFEPIGSLSTTNNHTIEEGLVWGANELKKINLKSNALPVFLLDTNRLNRRKMNEGVFENSWDIYHQDMPSANFFEQNNINKIIIVGRKVEEDLNKILYKFPKTIKIYFTNRYDEPVEIKLKKTKKEKF